jgi:tetratricopeptide (TPR) repeat protein
MNAENTSRSNPGGQAGMRGYLVQTLIALLDGLKDGHLFVRVTLEPDHKSEKIDILWEYAQGCRAVQVKSSINQFAKANVQKWAEELRAKNQDMDCELCLVGLFHPALAKLDQVVNVRLVKLNNDPPAFREQAAHRLDGFLCAQNLSCGTGKYREMLADALTARLATLSTTGEPLSRDELVELLRTWVSEAQQVKQSTVNTIEIVTDMPITEFNDQLWATALRGLLGQNVSKVRIVSIKTGSTIVRLRGDPKVLTEAVAALESSPCRWKEFAQQTRLRKVIWESDDVVLEVEVTGTKFGPPVLVPQRGVSASRLRHIAEHVFGREEELAALDQVWSNAATHVLTIVAWGGVGKTSLIAHWMARLARDDWRGAERVFDWSFYSQGNRERGVVSADSFIVSALQFFGDSAFGYSAASLWDKGARLAELVAQRRTLLVLDGLEPLQYPPGPVGGRLKDPGLEALLKGLAQHNPGLCIVTTRESVTDLKPFRDTTSPEWLLEHLSEEAGAHLLFETGAKRAGNAQIRADDKELKDAAREVGGHALTLQLLGRYLARAHNGDVRKRDLVRFEKADAKVQGGHAFKVMAAYEKWLGKGAEDGLRQLAVLRLFGLFDRPADSGCLTALRKEPAVTGLTEPLVGLGDDDWNFALSSLVDCGLISCHENQSEIPNRQYQIDCHPLIREYFAQRLQEQPEAWRAAHRRLYEHLCATTVDQPQPTLEDLQPLYQAVAHGCQAGLQQEACERVYFARIKRRGENYSVKKLGAFGSDLGAVACFFEAPWSRVSPALTEADQAWLLNEAAFTLRALGRLTEALEPMRVSGEMDLKVEQWKGAAISYSNLSELELTLGEVAGAVGDAEQSVTYADRSGNAFQRLSTRCTHADALRQAGRQAEAERRFREAEQMQAQRQPDHPLLYSLRGFQYCDLLLAEAERAAWQANQRSEDRRQRTELVQVCRAVSQRAAQTLKWVTTQNWLLDIALDHLTLGRAALYRAILEKSEIQNSKSEIEQAVAGLRRAGQADELPKALLTRAWLRSLAGDAEGTRTDLDDAWEIAERGPMKLFLADIHLYRARLFHAVTSYPWDKDEQGKPRGPKDDLTAARKLIEQCGHHRRDGELADAEEAGRLWRP